VPLALRAAKVSCLALKSCARVTPCLSAQALLIIEMNCSLSGSTASGASSCSSMVAASIFFTATTPLSWKARCDGLAIARSIENTASSAVNGLPSWKTTPLRSLKRHAVGDVICHDTASAGSTAKRSSRPTSDS
jgi:hypothetical protein